MRFALSLILCLGAAVQAAAQCPGGACPSRQPAAQSTQQTAEKLVASVALVASRSPGGGVGTGTIVERNDGRAYLFTCAHGLTDGEIVLVTFHDQRRAYGRVLERNTAADTGWIEVADLGYPAMAVAPSPPAADATVYFGGYAYGRLQSWRITTGRVRSVSSARLFATGPSRPGDSGGPVWDAEGRLVGCVSVSDFQTMTGIALYRARRATTATMHATAAVTVKVGRRARVVVQSPVVVRPRVVVQPPIVVRPQPVVRPPRPSSRVNIDIRGPLVLPPLPAPQSVPLAPAPDGSSWRPSGDLGLCVSPPQPQQPGKCGILPLRKPPPPPQPPTVIVQPDLQARESLHGIDKKLEVIVEAKKTPPPPEPAGGLPGWLVAVLVAGGVLIGAGLFYATQTHTPIGD